ncbi:MAG: protein-methionine-sulfoxide reductase catalytic subunit MsrP [Colwellia polaris]|jgi:sulfoxide reductase catalytic subunit YedY|uniref:protein-methionine-sulfoxide reductase catalytic subunit MsrP n=1 Tax=Colwellia polaris TaxID=326537 RepID=UPI000A175CA2|nr:protein-methionine-sulfoxide reductase catalytic subunit MsrP [Colwellia polaris]|tara:strand:- start:5575 stop:6585 length:1011 start_codon:yes stop_codon:yes gene_type:complete
MLIKTRKSYQLSEQQVTDESVYHSRRDLLKKLGYLGAGSLLAQSAASQASPIDFFSSKKDTVFQRHALTYAKAEESSQILTPEAKITTHNNFYEFGTNKGDPVENAQDFNVNPWQLKISGEVDKPYTLGYDDLFKRFPLEERIYRLRCVEAWSMVVPWVGFGLAQLIKQAAPNSKAKYVAFETLYDPKQMPGQESRRIGGGVQYPYVEGLRIDEAMNPLTFMSVGLYGKTLPAQNGAPIRLVVPWKYGFKSIKSIVGIKLVEHKPPTTWNILAKNEYGFYANVNPEVDHPRWSQASERRITTGGLFARNRIATLPFNGYGEEVAQLYKGMDLRKNY